jgi:membrane-bound serine protease (ClpP class)
MREIIKSILASPLPVLTYVAPAGARAASAGTYILYASHIAAMAPGTNLGAATPVQIGGRSPLPGIGGPREKEKDKKAGEKNGEDDKADGDKKAAKPKPGLSEKAVSDARAYIRSLAQMRGRNVEWAEKAVTEAASLSADDALKINVIDLTADTVTELLDKAHGRKVKMAAGTVTLATRGAATVTIEPDWRTRLLAAITNPNIAYILMMIGIYGIIFEFYNPGMIFSGVIGAICLVLALFALNVLPVNYAGLALILFGIALMAAEAFLPSFGILGIGGIVALVLGSVMLIDTDVPGFGISWVTIASVAATSGLLSLTVLAMAAKAWGRPVVSGPEAMIGMTGHVIDWQDGEGHVRVRGEVWRARSQAAYAPGGTVSVKALDGLTLTVGPADTEGTDNG